jgi:hypothetical protein
VCINAGQLFLWKWKWILAQKRTSSIWFQDTVWYIFFLPVCFVQYQSVIFWINFSTEFFYDILKSFYTALAFIPSSQSDEISERYDFLVPLELVEIVVTNTIFSFCIIWLVYFLFHFLKQRANNWSVLLMNKKKFVMQMTNLWECIDNWIYAQLSYISS